MRIRYKMEVVATNIPSSKAIIDKSCWNDEAEFKSGLANNRYFRLKLVAEALKPLFLGTYKKEDIRKINSELQKMSIKERLEYDYKQRGVK